MASRNLPIHRTDSPAQVIVSRPLRAFVGRAGRARAARPARISYAPMATRAPCPAPDFEPQASRQKRAESLASQCDVRLSRTMHGEIYRKGGASTRNFAVDYQNC